MNNTQIEWADHTFNPWRGCEKIAAGCAHCYAATLAKRNPKVLGTWGPAESGGRRVLAAEKYWDEPRDWEQKSFARRAAEKNLPRRARVFCASLADVFEDWPHQLFAVDGHPAYWCLNCQVAAQFGACQGCGDPTVPMTLALARQRLFDLIDKTPNLTWLLLTKRPSNIWRLAQHIDGVRYGVLGRKAAAHNVWFGISLAEQRDCELIPSFVKNVPRGYVRFLSVEPLISEIDLRPWLQRFPNEIHWVIVGGESGKLARPMHPDWARQIRDQCEEAHVEFFFKQWGDWLPVSQRADEHRHLQCAVYEGLGTKFLHAGKRVAGRLLDGRTWDEVPKWGG